MRIRASARNHGVADADIPPHAIEHDVRAFDSGEVLMIIGPARNGRCLKSASYPTTRPPRTIHAMPVRRKFWP